MRVFDWAAGVFCMLIGLLSSTGGMAQELKPAMSKALEAYRALQPFMVGAERFENPDNHGLISSQIQTLRNNIHTAQGVSSKFTKDPGFSTSLTILEEHLDDALKRFNAGKKGYALYKMRSISANCAACHTTYDVGSRLLGPEPSFEGMSNLERAEYHIAARQFDKAEAALDSAVREGKSALYTTEALRKWLVLRIRMNSNPGSTADILSSIAREVKLPIDEREAIQEWIDSLRRWQTEKIELTPTLENAEKLMHSSLGSGGLPLRGIDTVNMLRASATLHSVLASQKLSGSKRARALLLIGLSYYRLPFFFIDQLPAVYFEQCIEEFPGTPEAKQCYQFHKEKVILDFTGSGGTHLPADVAERLYELYEKAYGVPRFEGKV